MNVQAPFGGKKSSGIGREFGEYVSRLPLPVLCDAEAKAFYRLYEDLQSPRLFLSSEFIFLLVKISMLIFHIV